LLLLLLLLQARSDVKRLAEELALAHKQISSSRSKAEQVRQPNGHSMLCNWQYTGSPTHDSLWRCSECRSMT
jgi:hypothetical protein